MGAGILKVEKTMFEVFPKTDYNSSFLVHESAHDSLAILWVSLRRPEH